WQAAPLERLARSLYFGADRVVTLTPGIRRELLDKGISSEALDLIPNAFDDSMSRVDREMIREDTRVKYGWRDQFVAVYVGAFTEVTAVDVIIRTAAELRQRKDIRFDLYGSGQTRSKVMALAGEIELDNVHFHEAVPKAEVYRILAAADVGLMALFRSPLIHIYFENKLIDYMGASLPIAAAMGGVQPELIKREGAGLVVDSFDHKGLAKGIARLADDREVARDMGQAGHRFISTHLARSEVIRHYTRLLEAAAAGKLKGLPTWDPLNIC
ncbi:glycosyltransferase family 4 protein, partial [Ectothiorhodospira lacustris]|uniref:glycosyltransferase family 4 protein n=1 Tax=Ectothiorhodospira lacustris TaxID=2899127 RepID=UPI001EE96DAE